MYVYEIEIDFFFIHHNNKGAENGFFELKGQDKLLRNKFIFLLNLPSLSNPTKTKPRVAYQEPKTLLDCHN